MQVQQTAPPIRVAFRDDDVVVATLQCPSIGVWEMWRGGAWEDDEPIAEFTVEVPALVPAEMERWVEYGIAVAHAERVLREDRARELTQVA